MFEVIENRWISYTSINMPGNQSFELGFHANMNDAVGAYLSFCREMDGYDCTMTVYYAGGDAEMVASAKEFDGVGCPFDYPDRVIERGPRGGVKVSHC